MHTQISVDSEIGKLKAVLVHTPGREIENMTPSTAAEVLYDDILTLKLAQKEHAQLSGVLNKVALVYEFRDLLSDVLSDETLKRRVLKRICKLHQCLDRVPVLMKLDATSLAKQLLEGTPRPRNTFSRFLNPVPFILPPLPNAFFTRDATMCVNDRVIIGSMAHKVRTTEAYLLKIIFQNHPKLNNEGFYFDGTRKSSANLTIEGGDLLIIRDDTVVIGYSERTSVQGIDELLAAMSAEGKIKHAIVVELPKTRAAIHLDMIFTMINTDHCVIFPPLITGRNRCRVWRADLNKPCDYQIREHDGLLEALKSLDIDLKPVACGGDQLLNQEREQWASGANFFTIAPGQILGYGHNIHTLQALDQAGFKIETAKSFIQNDWQANEKLVVSIDGGELSRGGGGCRCMTMPLSREVVNWG